MTVFAEPTTSTEVKYLIDVMWKDAYTGTSSASTIEIIRYGSQASKTDAEADAQALALYDALAGLDMVGPVSVRKITAGQTSQAALEEPAP